MFNKNKIVLNIWIPVKESLPEPGYSYLVTAQNKIGERKVFKVSATFSQSPFWVTSDSEVATLKDWKTIAWMPLPDPYRGEE